MALKIRTIEKTDVDGFYELRNCPNASANTLAMPFTSKENAAKMVSRMTEEEGSTTLVAELDGKLVGSAELNVFKGRRRHCAALGISVHDDYQHKGIGTALMKALLDLADNWYNLKRIELEVYTDNEIAINMYKKFGFTIEGTLKCYAIRNGEYIDAYLMARVRP
ncbi:MAG: GNAT family N-acetyltransferase [Athalassotoga sp.]|uniref:GNAT family N-acetyltransferase n=2 Tax=Athalassotoga sp. TaxID=2022597 RepID=UPI003D06238B